MLAAVATGAARSRHRGGAASITAAVAAPAKIPADRPDSNRPSSSTHTGPATRNTTLLASAQPSPASSSGRRPRVSDHCPKASSAASTPAAYTAKITVYTTAENPSCCW